MNKKTRQNVYFCSELTDNSKLNPIKDEKNKSDAFAFSWLPSSFKVIAIASAILSISSGFMPREVTAAVPRRTPVSYTHLGYILTVKI